MVKENRESNIELLRMIAVMGVVVLHFNGAYGNAFGHVQSSSLNFYVLRYLESLFIPAVNIFILISGYYLSGSKRRKIVKPIYLLIQVMFFGELVYLLNVINGVQFFSIKSAIASLIPCNYYVILYSVLYLITPYINKLLDHLEEKELRHLLVLCISIFSVWATLVDVAQEVLEIELLGLSSIGLSGSQEGYTIVNFCLVYLIGAYIKKRNIEMKTSIAVIMIVVTSIVLTIWSIHLPKTAWMYCNFLVIWEAICWFFVFKENCFYNKLVNKLAQAVFTCFLFHGFFLQNIQVENLVNGSAIRLVFSVFILVVGIYGVCVIVYFLWSMIENHILKKILSAFNKYEIKVK